MTQMNPSMKEKHRHREQTGVCQGGGGDVEWEAGVSRWKL